MSLENDRETVLVMVAIHKRKGQSLPETLTDVLADKAYNHIAISGKTCEVTAQIVELAKVPWEVAA